MTVHSDEEDTLARQLSLLEHNPLGLAALTDKILNQDVFEALDLLPDNFIDLVFADPPYNINKKFNTIEFKRMQVDSYEEYTRKWIAKLKSKLKNEASIYVCGDWRSSSVLFNVLSEYFIIRNRITFEREKGRGAKNNFKNCAEDIFFCTNSSRYSFNVARIKLRRKVMAPYKANGKPKDWQASDSGNYRDTHPSNIWTDITIPFWSMPENTEHPTQKPEKLLAKIILASSNEGDMVFDPFLGSGTTAVVAKKLDRRYLGIEMDRKYCLIAQKRILAASKNTTIQGYEDGVFWERNSLNRIR